MSGTGPDAGPAAVLGLAPAAALARVPPAEHPELLAWVDALARATPADLDAPPGYLELLRSATASPALKTAVGLLLHRRRHAAAGDVGCARGWTDACRDALAAAARRPDLAVAPPRCMPELTDGDFVQASCEVVLGRGCQAAELAKWSTQLRTGELTREDLLARMLQDALAVQAREAAQCARAEQVFYVMGTGERVSQAEWQARARERGGTAAPPPAPFPWRLAEPRRVRVSAITSLYAGGEHIERFLENIVGQTCFREHAELIVVDADSPDGERAVIERYQRDWPNIRYLRINHRVGIYDAWNVGVRAARGDFLTSANVDDLRRADSLERQACVLAELPFVDVVYQDFWYTMDASLTFDEIAAVGYRSALPLVTPHGLMALNPPHNAPMWRRSLHDELGLFDASFVSAGDYEFWMRCAVAGKTFFKLNDPHVAYFQNPRGISTRPDTRGYDETRRVHRRYGRDAVAAVLGRSAAQLPLEAGARAADADGASHRDAVHAALVKHAAARPLPAVS